MRGLKRMLMQPGIVRDGLILNLDAGDKASYPGSGTIIYDVSGNGNNGELLNGVAFSSENQGCLIFDGGNDNLQLSTLITGLTKFTVELLLNFPLYSYQQIGFNFADLKWRATGQPYFNFWDTTGDYNALALPVPSLNNAHLFTAAYANPLRKVLTDGVLANSYTENITPQSQVKLKITGQNDELLKGKLYAVRVYNRALSDAEILQNYNALKYRFL